MGLLWLVLPVFIAYSIAYYVGEFAIFPPTLITLFAPFFLLFVNIHLSKRNNSKFPILRVFHCIMIVFFGFVLSNFVINSYFFNIGETKMDDMTKLLCLYEFVFDIIVVVIGMVVYQFKLLIKR